MSFLGLKNKPIDIEYTRMPMRIIGIGNYGIQAINALKRDGINNTKYSTVDSGNQNIKKLIQFINRADVVFIIADISSGSSMKTVQEIIEMSKEKSKIVFLILLLPDDCSVNESGILNNLGINELKRLADTLFIISRENSSVGCLHGNNNILHEEYKQIYGCVKALTDICGDRLGYINTDLGDIAGTIRNAGIGYIGFGEAKGENAIGEATNLAIQNLANYDKLQNASGVIATISYQDCSMGDTLLFLDKIGQSMSTEAIFNYNIYSTNNVDDLCTVIILVMGYKQNCRKNSYNVFIKLIGKKTR